jgi:DNA-binding transcriptional ArsR family regulator
MVQKITKEEVLLPFLAKPYEKIHLARLSKITEIPHPTLRQWLAQFEAKGIVYQEKQGRQTQYVLKWNHPLLIDYILIAEKHKLIYACTKHTSLMRCVELLHHYAKNNAILIFGSAVIDFEKAQDIDIIIGGKISPRLEQFLQNNVFRFEPIIVRDLKKISAELTEEVKKKHLLIENSEKIIRWLYGDNSMVQKAKTGNTIS